MRKGPGTTRMLTSLAIRRLAMSLLVAALLVGGQHAGAAELHGTVVGVSDGDTLTVLDPARVTHRVRLNGIDAPEHGQPWGRRAKEQLATLAFGKEVTVAWNKRDRYGRIVGRVQLAAPGSCSIEACAPSADVGLRLVEIGFAWHYKRYQHEQTPEDRSRYALAENDARSKRAGLWHDAQPVAPWDFRSHNRTGSARGAATVRYN